MADPIWAETDGIWLIRAGVFGAPDSQIEGAAVAIEQGRIVGGDKDHVYYGECRTDGNAIIGEVHVLRHSDAEHETFFGSTDREYSIEFVGQLVSPAYYEGNLKVSTGIEGRMFMMRLAELPPRRMN
jgi:hypothetical protein